MNKYKRLILKNSFLICLIFSVLFLFSFYFERYSFSKNSYEQQSRQALKEVSQALDNSFIKAQDLSVLFHRNDIFEEYVESSSPTPSLRYNLSKFISSAIHSMPTTTASVFVTQPNDEYILTSGALMSPSFFSETYGINYEELMKLISEESQAAIPSPYVYFTEVDKQTYFTIAIRNDIYFNGSYTIILVYDMKALLPELPKSTSVLISQGDIPLYCGRDFSSEQITALLNGENIDSFTTVATYSSATTMLGQLTYTLVLPEPIYLLEINQHLLFSIFSFFLLFILSVFLSRKISSKTYKPIDRLVSQISEIGAETSDNEIEAISSFITLLNKRNKELNTTINTSESFLREKFFNDFLHGHLTEEKAIHNIYRYFPAIDDISSFFIVVLDVDLEDKNTIENSENLLSFYGIIRTLLEREFSTSSLLFLTTITPSVFGFVVSHDNVNVLTEKLKNLLISTEIDLGVSIHSTISDKISLWKKLPRNLLSTYYRHTSSSFSITPKTVTSVKEHNLTVIYSPELENDVYTNCVRQNKEKLISSLNFLLKENFNNNMSFEESRSQLSILFYALCTRISVFCSIEIENIFGKDYNIYHKMKHCENFYEFSETVHYIFATLSDTIKNIQAADEHNHGEKMLEYIHQNYHNDISLHDLASYMNMSQAYVSRLFKKLTSFNFKDYLAKIRIEKATSLLVENPSKSVQEIALLVGYNNAKPFTALFIKTMGVSPSEYRKMRIKN